MLKVYKIFRFFKQMSTCQYYIFFRLKLNIWQLKIMNGIICCKNLNEIIKTFL